MPTPRPDGFSDIESQIVWVSFVAWFNELPTIEQARFVLHCQREIDDHELGQVVRLAREQVPRWWRKADVDDLEPLVYRIIE